MAEPMTRPSEDHFNPFGEAPEPHVYLEERAADKTVSGVYFLRSGQDLPLGMTGLGLELSTSEVLIVLAKPVIDPRYAARLLLRWIEGQKVWSRSVDQRHRWGRGRADPDHPSEPNAGARRFKKFLHGQTIRFFARRAEPTSEGGEEAIVMFRSGEGVRLRALPGGPVVGGPADLDVEFLRHGRVVVV